MDTPESSDYVMIPADSDQVGAAGDAESVEFITMDGPFDFPIADQAKQEKNQT